MCNSKFDPNNWDAFFDKVGELSRPKQAQLMNSQAPSEPPLTRDEIYADLCVGSTIGSQ